MSAFKGFDDCLGSSDCVVGFAEILMVFTSYSTANNLMRTIRGRCIPQAAWAGQGREMLGNVASETAELRFQVSDVAAAIPCVPNISFGLDSTAADTYLRGDSCLG